MVPTSNSEYSIYSPKRFSYKETAFNHNIFQTDGGLQIVPITFSDKSLNPKKYFWFEKNV